ncbi:MAG: DUF502 domain-containing protein [Opitutales bacterium]
MSDSPEKTTFASRLSHNFLTGLFLLLPVGLTLYVVSVLLDLMGKFIQPAVELGFRWLWANANQPAPDFTLGLPRQLVVVSSAVVMICILIVVGYLSKRLFGKLLHRWFAALLERIPGLGSLYGTIRQMVDALSGRNKDTFRRVVMVEFPRPGMWSIAFVTHEQPTVFSEAVGKQVVNVFIPAAPAPTTGVILHVAPEDVRETKLTVGEALGLLMSFGSVVPKPASKE